MGLFDNKPKIPDGVSGIMLQTAIIKRGGYTVRRRSRWMGFEEIEDHEPQGCVCQPCQNYRRSLLNELQPLVKEEERRIEESNCPNQFTSRTNVVDTGVHHAAAEVDVMRQRSEGFMEDYMNKVLSNFVIAPASSINKRQGFVSSLFVSDRQDSDEEPEEVQCPKCEFKPCRLCKK